MANEGDREWKQHGEAVNSQTANKLKNLATVDTSSGGEQELDILRLIDDVVESVNSIRRKERNKTHKKIELPRKPRSESDSQETLSTETNRNASVERLEPVDGILEQALADLERKCRYYFIQYSREKRRKADLQNQNYYLLHEHQKTQRELRDVFTRASLLEKKMADIRADPMTLRQSLAGVSSTLLNSRHLNDQEQYKILLDYLFPCRSLDPRIDGLFGLVLEYATGARVRSDEKTKIPPPPGFTALSSQSSYPWAVGGDAPIYVKSIFHPDGTGEVLMKSHINATVGLPEKSHLKVPTSLASPLIGFVLDFGEIRLSKPGSQRGVVVIRYDHEQAGLVKSIPKRQIKGWIFKDEIATVRETLTVDALPPKQKGTIPSFCIDLYDESQPNLPLGTAKISFIDKKTLEDFPSYPLLNSKNESIGVIRFTIIGEPADSALPAQRYEAATKAKAEIALKAPVQGPSTEPPKDTKVSEKSFVKNIPAVVDKKAAPIPLKGVSKGTDTAHPKELVISTGNGTVVSKSLSDATAGTTTAAVVEKSGGAFDHKEPMEKKTEIVIKATMKPIGKVIRPVDKTPSNEGGSTWKASDIMKKFKAVSGPSDMSSHQAGLKDAKKPSEKVSVETKESIKAAPKGTKVAASPERGAQEHMEPDSLKITDAKKASITEAKKTVKGPPSSNGKAAPDLTGPALAVHKQSKDVLDKTIKPKKDEPSSVKQAKKEAVKAKPLIPHKPDSKKKEVAKKPGVAKKKDTGDREKAVDGKEHITGGQSLSKSNMAKESEPIPAKTKSEHGVEKSSLSPGTKSKGIKDVSVIKSKLGVKETKFSTVDPKKLGKEKSIIEKDGSNIKAKVKLVNSKEVTPVKGGLAVKIKDAQEKVKVKVLPSKGKEGGLVKSGKVKTLPPKVKADKLVKDDMKKLSAKVAEGKSLLVKEKATVAKALPVKQQGKSTGVGLKVKMSKPPMKV